MAEPDGKLNASIPKDSEAMKIFEFLEKSFQGDLENVEAILELIPGVIYAGALILLVTVTVLFLRHLRDKAREIFESAQTASTFGKFGGQRRPARLSEHSLNTRLILLALPLLLFGIIGLWGALTSPKISSPMPPPPTEIRLAIESSAPKPPTCTERQPPLDSKLWIWLVDRLGQSK